MSTTEICRMCLSTERAMFYVEDVRWAYSVLTDTHTSEGVSERVSLAAVRVCWECRAALRRVLRLRSQALRAQLILSLHANEVFSLQCLSKLSCSTKAYFDQDFTENIEFWTAQKGDIDLEDDIKSEIDCEAADLDVFAESIPPDKVDQNVSVIKELKPKIEMDAVLIQEKTELRRNAKHKGKRSTMVKSRIDKCLKYKNLKLDSKPQVLKSIKKKKKKSQKESDIQKLCEKVLYDTNEQVLEKLEVEINEKYCYRCVVCDSKFIDEEDSQSHLEEHRSNNSWELLRCRLCTYLTGNANEMRRHHDAKHQPAKQRLLKSDLSKKKSTGFDCEVCGLHVKTYDYFKIHHKTHTQPQTYQCDICNVTYRLRNQMLRHLKWHEMRYLCEICGKRFKELPPLNIHYLSHSTIEARPYACQLCPRKFITKDKLVAHLTLHEGVKPFSCDQCDRRFRMKFDLTRHKKLRHSTGVPVKAKQMERTKSLFRNNRLLIDDKTGEIKPPITRRKAEKTREAKQKSYQCNICGKKFAQKNGLDSHAVFHTGERPHKCDECDLTFKYTAGLWSHKLLHKGVKPHQCTVCGAQFTLKGNLKGHMKIHSNDKPYECDICGQRFPWRRNLRNHFKVHSK